MLRTQLLSSSKLSFPSYSLQRRPPGERDEGLLIQVGRKRKTLLHPAL